jgi:tetratricopeptide (TPR) repeat protein
MITKKGIALAAVLLAIGLSFPLLAQRPRNNDQQKGQAPPPPVDYRPKPTSQEEYTAFKAIEAEPNPANKVTLADNFLTTYPSSQLAGFVQRFRMESFSRTGKFKEAAAAGEQALALEMKYLEMMLAKADADAAAAKNASNDKNKKQDKNAPPAPPPIDKNSPAFKALVEETERAMMYYYQNLMSSYQQLNDAPKTMEWAQKALGQDPEDLLTLLTLSSVMAARPSTDAKEMEKQMKEAEEHGKKALAKVNALMSSPMAAQMRPEDKASLTSSAHQTLGRIYYNLKKYPDSQKAYGAAIVAKKDDAEAYFYLGLALAQDKPPKVEDAMESLAKAVFLKGPTEAQANEVLKQLYQNVKKSMDGYDDFVKQAGEKIPKG